MNPLCSGVFVFFLAQKKTAEAHASAVEDQSENLRVYEFLRDLGNFDSKEFVNQFP